MIRVKTLELALDSYLSDHLGISDWYSNQLVRIVRQFTQWSERRELDQWKDAIVGWMKSLKSKGRSPTSINTARTRLLTLLRAAHIKVGRIPKMPELLPLPEAWTMQQCEEIFSACAKWPGMVGHIPASDWWLSLAVSIYWTGERINAMRSIRSEDCDLSAGTMVIRAVSHKSRKDRLLWIPEQAAELIALHYDPSRVFLWDWPHCRRHLFTQFRKILESAKVPCPKSGKSLFHRLRRTSGSLVEAFGGDGARHLGNSRKVFEAHYLDRRITMKSQAKFLPIPNLERKHF